MPAALRLMCTSAAALSAAPPVPLSARRPSTFFNNISVDYAFISCDAIGEDGEVYSDNVAVATVESAILHNAVHKYVLCDSTKLGKKSVAHIYNLKKCDALITGKNDTLAAERIARICNIIFA